MKEKLIIYQVLPRLFGNPVTNPKQKGTLKDNGSGKFSSFTHRVLQEINSLGCNYIWYTGVIEHATKSDFRELGIPLDNPLTIKGEAGSPYAIKDYYDVNPYLADDPNKRMAEFEELVERSHDNGLRVILDFVPNHVARQYHSDQRPQGVTDFGDSDNSDHSFNPQNNYYYIPHQILAGDIFPGEGEIQYREYPAKATGNDCFHAYPSTNDWYETVKLNYGVDYASWGAKHFDPIPDTWHKMLHILMYWSSKGVDAFRCDMAEMVPVEFWGWVIPKVKQIHRDIIFIAEVYNPELYYSYVHNGGFDYLYDKVGLYDTLRAVVNQDQPASAITNSWQSLGEMTSYMLNFLENHDEQRIASSFFAGSPDRAMPAMVVTALMNSNPVMLYFGQELGEPAIESEGFSGHDGRTSIFDYWSIDSIERWYNHGACNLKRLKRNERDLRETYSKLLNIARFERSVVDGLFFDLMYVNPRGEFFDPNCNYAFMRYCEGELILVVVSFHPEELECRINIPQHAFDYFQIESPIKGKATDLFTNKNREATLSSNRPFVCTLKPYGSLVLKFVCNNLVKNR
ncbi:MAG: alpha-amylase family protein [Bacteroidales bacterium]